MKIHPEILSGLIILALISLSGICAADGNTGNPLPGNAHFYPHSSSDLNASPQLPDGDHYNWTGNWTGNRTQGNWTDGNWTGNWTEWQGVSPDCDGIFGAESPFYGLKLAFENLDESFTFNKTERIEKQIDHGQNRLFELNCELVRNRTANADHILDLYREKMNETGDLLGPFQPNDTGLLHAREMIAKHRLILENLSAEHPDNRGLENAFWNSGELQLKFDEKIQKHFNQTEGWNATAPALHLGEMGNRPGRMDNGTNQTPPGEEKWQGNGNGNNPPVKTNGEAGNQNERNNQQQNTGQSQQQNSGRNGKDR